MNNGAGANGAMAHGTLPNTGLAGAISKPQEPQQGIMSRLDRINDILRSAQIKADRIDEVVYGCHSKSEDEDSPRPEDCYEFYVNEIGYKVERLHDALDSILNRM